MDIKHAVDAVRARAATKGHEVSMARGRDLASEIMFRRPYSAAFAANAAGKLDVPFGLSIDAKDRLSPTHGKDLVAVFYDEAMSEVRRLRHEHLAEAPQTRQRFRCLSYLFVYPDVDGVFERTGDVPWVSFTELDFSELTALYKTELRLHTSTSIYSLDDYLDSTDVGLALRTNNAVEALRPFGASVLKPTLRLRDGVVKVRDRWKPFHRVYPTRVRIPPPAVLGFVTEHFNYEDGLAWEREVRGVLLRTHSNLFGSGMFKPRPEVSKPGRLPPGLKAGLERFFGVPFGDDVFIDRIAHSPFPAWLERAAGR